MITANDTPFPPPGPPDTGGHGLSTRQRQVLELAAQGLTRRQIARRLGLREYTVNEHLKQIYRKLKVHNRVGAVTLAMRQGLLETTRPAAGLGPVGIGDSASGRLAHQCPRCGCRMEVAGWLREGTAGRRWLDVHHSKE